MEERGNPGEEGTISMENLLKSFSVVGVELQKDQLSFLVMAMILKSASLNELNFRNLLQLFSNRNDGDIDEADEDREDDEHYEAAAEYYGNGE